MTKKIDFVTMLGSKKVLVTKEVDMGTLSPYASALASAIITTDDRDDASHVRIHCKYTNKELWEKVVNGELKEAYLGEKRFYKSYVNNMNGIISKMGEEYVNTIPSEIHRWDCLKKYETPEQYFERHAKSIVDNERADVRLLESDLLGQHIAV